MKQGKEVDCSKDYNNVCCDLCGENLSRETYSLDKTYIVECLNCGFHYVSPRITSEILNDRIQNWSVKDTVDDERLRIAFEENTLNLYKRFIKKLQRLNKVSNKRFLDIGCSVGAFLTVARDQGYDVRGLELGKASSEYASDKLGLEVMNKSLYEYKGEDGKFDVVSMLEVIEHLEYPSKAIKTIHSMLRPEGLLFLTTPNFDSLYQRIHGAKWWVINCEDEHIMLFNYVSMKELLEKNGFEIEYYEIRGFDIVGILRNFRKRKVVLPELHNGGEDYYVARDNKEKIKSLMKSLYLDGLARLLLRGIDVLFSLRYSPLFGMGEQLIVIARKKP